MQFLEKIHTVFTATLKGQLCLAIIQVYIASDSVITTRGYCTQSSLYGENRFDLPVEVYECCAAVPHSTQQRYYNEAARQE